MSDLNEKFQELTGKVKEEVTKVVEDKQDEAEGLAENIGESIKDGIEGAGEFVKGLFNKDK